MVTADVAADSLPGKRIAAIDVVRGIAIIAMIAYHFAWDLWIFGLTTADVGYGPYWRLFAHAIATTFLGLVGVGLVLATRRGLQPRPFMRRLAFIAAGAALVTVATYVIDPGTFVFFGILHLIALATLLAVPFLALPWWASAITAAVVIAVGNLYASPVFNAPWLVWSGLGTQVPATVDYYPLLPWFGVVLGGIAAGKLFIGSGADATVARWDARDPVSRFLVLAGRWSLVIYLLHQVVLYEAVAFAAQYLGQPGRGVGNGASAEVGPAQTFMDQCLPVCGQQQGKDAQTCTGYCGCMYAGLTGANLISLAPSAFTADQRTRFDAIVRQCSAAPPGR